MSRPLITAPRRNTFAEVLLLVLLFFVYAGDAPPMVNEAHYLVKAKNFWQPDWCARDLFAASAKAHTTFYWLFGWPTMWFSLSTTAWIGRLVGWIMLAVGLQRLSSRLIPQQFAALGVAVLWIVGIEYGNLAGEWVVGGIEAKVPAYGLLLWGLAELVDRRWSRVWYLLGAASAFHVLAGGWAVVAAMLAWWMTERQRPDRQPLITPALFLGGALSLFGLVPALALTMGAAAEQSSAAVRIYVYFRLAHHLLPSAFANSWYVRHGMLIAATALAYWYLPGRRQLADQQLTAKEVTTADRDAWIRLVWFVAGALILAAVGMLVGVLTSYAPNLAAKLLRYYWFRLTDVVVALLFALLIMRLLQSSTGMIVRQSIAAAVLIAAVGLFTYSAATRTWTGVPPSVSNRLLGWDADASRQQQRQVFEDWLAVCRWAKAATPEDEIFLTPRHQQTFKWYAQRAEVVNWKDVPQDATSLLEWKRRFHDVFPQRLGTMRVTIQYTQLREYRQRYDARYMIVDRRITGPNLPLVQVYPRQPEVNRTYAVYRLPQ